MKTQYLDTVFDSAKANMDHDEATLNQAQSTPNTRFIRIYTWTQPGLTTPKNRPVEDLVNCYDYGPRVTGGGLVFHCPGDVLFTIVSPVDDPAFPKALKEKVLMASKLIGEAFTQCGIDTYQKPICPPSTQNRAFCQTYLSPYERYYNDEKCTGITLKRAKNQVIIQCMIHLKSTLDYFPDLSEDHKGFCNKNTVPVSDTALKEALTSTCKKTFEVSKPPVFETKACQN